MYMCVIGTSHVYVLKVPVIGTSICMLKVPVMYMCVKGTCVR